VTINAVPVEPMDFPLPVTPVDIWERIEQSACELSSFNIKRVFVTAGGINIKRQFDDMESDMPIGNYLIECVSAGKLAIYVILSCYSNDVCLDSVFDKVLSDEVQSTKSQSSTGTVNLNKVLFNIANENLVRVLFRVTTRAVPLGLCQGGVVGYFHIALSSVIQHGVVQRTTVDEIQISVEGTRDTIDAVHEELRKLKSAHFARDPKMLWSLEVKVIDPNCLRHRYASFAIIRDSSVRPGTSFFSQDIVSKFLLYVFMFHS
jgi:hypothetical protein